MEKRCWPALVVLALVSCTQPPKTPDPAPPPPTPPAVVDGDGDGIADAQDKCPDKKEDGLDPDAKDGCPSDDPDQDGIVGAADKCPDKPETKNGFQDDDGCPDEKPAPKPRPPQRVGTTAEKIEINEEIRFASGKADVEKSSVDLVHTIAGELKMHPDVDFIEIAGHADKRGNDKQNLTLTQKRSEAVLKMLVGAGVNPKRLRATGFGSLCPLDPAETEEAFTKNRRVEFHILRRGGEDLKDHWKGCEASEKQGVTVKAVPDTAPKSGDMPLPKEVTLVEGRLLLPADILFVPGKTDMKPESEPALVALSAYLAKNKQFTRLRIEGHTAPDPHLTEDDHTKLSKGRSKVVVDWLVNKGTDAKRLLSVGCADHRHVFRGKKVDVDRSRRTELHVVETSGKPEVGVPVVPKDCEE